MSCDVAVTARHNEKFRSFIVRLPPMISASPSTGATGFSAAMVTHQAGRI